MAAKKSGTAASTKQDDKYCPESALEEYGQPATSPPNKEVGVPAAAEAKGTPMDVDRDPTLSARVDDYQRKRRVADIKEKLRKDMMIYAAIGAKTSGTRRHRTYWEEDRRLRRTTPPYWSREMAG
jgi:hypothetical protein